MNINHGSRHTETSEKEERMPDLSYYFTFRYSDGFFLSPNYSKFFYFVDCLLWTISRPTYTNCQRRSVENLALRTTRTFFSNCVHLILVWFLLWNRQTSGQCFAIVFSAYLSFWHNIFCVFVVVVCLELFLKSFFFRLVIHIQQKFSN